MEIIFHFNNRKYSFRCSQGQSLLVCSLGKSWLMSADPCDPTNAEWLGWLPRNEFHVECVGEKFIEKVLG